MKRYQWRTKMAALSCFRRKYLGFTKLPSYLDSPSFPRNPRYLLFFLAFFKSQESQESWVFSAQLLPRNSPVFKTVFLPSLPSYPRNPRYLLFFLAFFIPRNPRKCTQLLPSNYLGFPRFSPAFLVRVPCTLECKIPSRFVLQQLCEIVL